MADATTKKTSRTPARGEAQAAAAKPPAPKRPAKKAASAKTPTKRASTSAVKSASATTESAPEREVPIDQAAPPAQPAPAGSESAATDPSRSWPGAPVHRGLGVALLGLAGAGRFTGGVVPVVPGPGGELPGEPVLDVALGLVDVALDAAERASDSVRRRLDPLLRRAWSPAAGPMTGTAGTALRVLAALTEPLAERGRRLRADSEHEAAASVAAVLPETIELVMRQLDLTQLAIDNVDIERVLYETVNQVDLTQFAIDNIDLARVIDASLDQVDFTGMAISRLDFARAVTAALEQMDVLTVARDQLDPAKVAAYLRDNVDVAEALRTAPSAMAGEAVRRGRETMGRIVRATSGQQQIDPGPS